MRIKFHATLSGKESEEVMDVINELGIDKNKFAANAIRMLASEISKSVNEKMEAMKKYEADRLATEEQQEGELSEPLQTDIEEQECDTDGNNAVD